MYCVLGIIYGVFYIYIVYPELCIHRELGELVSWSGEPILLDKSFKVKTAGPLYMKKTNTGSTVYT